MNERATDSGTAALALLSWSGPVTGWAPTVQSLRRAALPVRMLVEPAAVATAEELYGGVGVEVVAASPAEALNAAVAQGWRSVLVVTSPVVLPPDPLGPALALLADDIRVATVSFLTNHGGHLSFPRRNHPDGIVLNGHDEASLTRALRDVPADAGVPLLVPGGSAVLVSAAVVRAFGGLDPACPRVDTALIDLALRCARRGLRNLLDASTFVVRPMQHGDVTEPHRDDEQRAWLHARHHLFPEAFDEDVRDERTPLADALALRRAHVMGLRVMLEASCLGPHEMGTQVATLAQVAALARHPRVREVVVATPGGVVPDYARATLDLPGVTVVALDGLSVTDATGLDVLHRPYQPDGPLPIEEWRAAARRIVLTVQDLVAYDNGHYHLNAWWWSRYRRAMRDAVGGSDAVVTISHDVARAVRAAGLPVAPHAVCVIENGTDHLRRADAVPVPPAELDGEAAGDPFLLVLGATYAHKNRDLAVRAWQLLREKHPDLRLVLAGFVVPLGGTRDEEVLALLGDDEAPTFLPDVTTAERDWLLEHAEVVLYPTSGEGFGLVPFEAAVFGTPTVFVGFGPLAELLPHVPVVAGDWSPQSIADAVDALVSDPSVGRAQVAAVESDGARLTWERFADELVDLYFDALARPATWSRPAGEDQ
ncbi:glycosyltransferase [Cellulomonas sp. Sa3CUA2]|uniref:Glycosyltransferase n=1 Tax=Cellulomonas avistercoris TaxID=2762242 RepID=A0ABR8QIF7_9CELL|nr:glycosyltransferase [Cellulomonas avistercoris]MBD7920217.1 glycosyltransferase [Cellulomonas avistercoris]